MYGDLPDPDALIMDRFLRRVLIGLAAAALILMAIGYAAAEDRLCPPDAQYGDMYATITLQDC